MADKKLQIVLELVDKASAQLKQVSGSFDNLANTAKKVGAGMTVAGGAITAFSGLAVKAFQEQERAEARLVQITKQTTGATEEQVAALQAQAEALQKVGVIGDEVTMVGQSQLATFALNTDAIAELTPAMLDMAVATKGVNASQEDMINIGNMIGKVMQGQVGALSRVGVTFSEAQAEILKTGDEMEKAAVLSEILEQNFGGLNEATRATSEGGMKALQNDLGDLMETIGEVIANALIPIVEFLTPVVEQLQSWADENPRLFQTIVVIVAALGALMLVLGPILIILPSLIAGFSAAATVIGLLFSPITLIVLAIGGLIAAIVLLIRNWDAVKAHAQEVWQSMADHIYNKIQKIKGDIEAWWENVKAKFNEGLETLKSWWEAAWQFMADHVGIIMGILFAVATGGMSLIIGWFIDNREKIVGALASVWDNVKERAIGAFNGIKSAIQSTMSFIISKVNKFIGGVNKVLSKVPGLDLTLPTIPQLAEGGIVTKPTLAMIGEGGQSEAVVPLSKAGQMGFGGGGTTININWSGAVDERSAEMVASMIARKLDIEGRTSIALGAA